MNSLKSSVLNGADVLPLQKDMTVTIIFNFWKVSFYFPAHMVNPLCNFCEISHSFYIELDDN